MASTTRTTATIVLTGFMGTGKSTVGRIIADRLGIDFVDSDAEIERRHGSIPAIFADGGEARFRELEGELVTELCELPGPMVIATGGGMLVDPDNAARLSRVGLIYTLTAEPDEILRRVDAGSGDRPLLAGPTPSGEVDRLLRDRAAAYALGVQVPTDGHSATAVANLIVDDATRRGIVSSTG